MAMAPDNPDLVVLGREYSLDRLRYPVHLHAGEGNWDWEGAVSFGTFFAGLNDVCEYLGAPFIVALFYWFRFHTRKGTRSYTTLLLLYRHRGISSCHSC